MGDDPGGHAAEQEAGKPRASLMAHDDQIALLCRGAADAPPPLYGLPL